MPPTIHPGVIGGLGAIRVAMVEPRAPLTPQQELIATLRGLGFSYEAIAHELGIGRLTVKWHIEEAAQKIPGDLPGGLRLAVWARGGSYDVLTGTALRHAVGLPPLSAGGAILRTSVPSSAPSGAPTPGDA